MKTNFDMLQLIAHTIRGLAIDTVTQAKSGHPGLPLGCAEIFAYLYAKQLRYDYRDSKWIGRDYFFLSAGHGSAGLYASLALSGFLTVDDLKQFRQLGSRTPGHPEFGRTPGVEATTGPLGQGFGMAVGCALSLKMAEERFKLPPGILGKVYVLASDGDFMEGINHESADLAGQWGLDNLIVIYDCNGICLDGQTDPDMANKTKDRYRSYGWRVKEIDGHNLQEIEDAFSVAHHDSSVEVESDEEKKPLLVIAKTIIGKYSPLAGRSESHGKPLSSEQVSETKKNFGFPEDQQLYIPEEVKNFFEDRSSDLQNLISDWKKSYQEWREENPSLAQQFDDAQAKKVPQELREALKKLELQPDKSTRFYYHEVLQVAAKHCPWIVGGSADLSSSDLNFIEGSDGKKHVISTGNYSERNIDFGVREHAMGAIMNGIALQGIFLPVCSTFMAFSDYMRPAIRLAALMKLPTVFVYSHDSFCVGEDGPTHQPVEQLATLRAIPNLTTIRPADGEEMIGSWQVILRCDKAGPWKDAFEFDDEPVLKNGGPVALITSRQNTITTGETDRDFVRQGGYTFLGVGERYRSRGYDAPDWCIIATGSEIGLAHQVAQKLREQYSKLVNIVSIPSWELFLKQSRYYQKQEVFYNPCPDEIYYCLIEAGVRQGWDRIIPLFPYKDTVFITMETFGESGTEEQLRDHFGFTVDKIIAKMIEQEMLS